MTRRSIPAFATVAGLVAVAAVAGRWTASTAPLSVVHAASAQADEEFAVCTTPVDDGTEGFFILDFQTGDISGGVLNQNAGKFVRGYRYNVLKDLGFKAGRVKSPRFMMVGGNANFRGAGANQFGLSVLYVTDVSTGVTAAYGVPWNPTWTTTPPPGVEGLVLLDVARPRGGAAPAPARGAAKAP